MRARPALICKGFTLLEILVVLVITALISTVLIQGLSQAFQVRNGFETHIQNSESGILPEYWFRASVQSLIADYPALTHRNFFQAADAHEFKGDSSAFSGLTLTALDADNGVPMPFTWRVTRVPGATVLEYGNSRGDYWEVWRGDSADFVYLDKHGEQHAQWPPRRISADLGGTPGFTSLSLMPNEESVPQLPRAIILSGFQRNRPFTWFSAVQGRNIPPLDYRLID
jgi:general secretion pathway protein J